MKKFIIIILGLIVLVAATGNQSKEGQLVKKFYLDYHHTENCSNHSSQIGKLTFEDEGHEMWIYFRESNAGGSFTQVSVVHSPDCKLCNPKEETVLEETTTTSNYWGW